MTDPCANLTEIVRTGRTTLSGDGSVDPENPMWVDFAHSMAPMMAPMTAPLGHVVLKGVSGPVRVLDIAAGHGIEIAKQNPQARIVVLDWAPVPEVAKAKRIKPRWPTVSKHCPAAPSMWSMAAVRPRVVDQFSAPFRPCELREVAAHRLLMLPAGRVAALEFVPNEDRVTPPLPAMFSMIMLTTTLSGDAYTFRELESMYREAGFQDATLHPVPTGPSTVVMSRA